MFSVKKISILVKLITGTSSCVTATHQFQNQDLSPSMPHLQRHLVLVSMVGKLDRIWQWVMDQRGHAGLPMSSLVVVIEVSGEKKFNSCYLSSREASIELTLLFFRLPAPCHKQIMYTDVVINSQRGLGKWFYVACIKYDLDFLCQKKKKKNYALPNLNAQMFGSEPNISVHSDPEPEPPFRFGFEDLVEPNPKQKFRFVFEHCLECSEPDRGQSNIWSDNIFFKWSKDNFAIFLIPCEIAKVDKEGFDIFSIEVRISPIELTEIQSSPTDVEI